MNVWHPLPRPVMVPLSFVTSESFRLGFGQGLVCAAAFFLAFALMFCVFWLVRHDFMRLLRRVLPILLFSLLFSSVAGAFPPGTVQTFSLSESNSFPVSPAGFSVYQGSSLVCTSAQPHGWSFTLNRSASGQPMSMTFTGYPNTTDLTDTFRIIYAGPEGTFNAPNFIFSAAPSPSGDCSSAYPSTVSMYLADAPSPCAYFNASQGFNASTAPLLLAVLGVLVAILAVWLGHDTIMSIFRRLVTGMS